MRLRAFLPSDAALLFLFLLLLYSDNLRAFSGVLSPPPRLQKNLGNLVEPVMWKPKL